MPLLTLVPAGAANASLVMPTATGQAPTAPTTVASPVRYPVSVRKGVQYGTGRVQAPTPQQVPLLLDLYEPTGAPKPRPFAIVIHGGGFRYGARDHEQAVRLAQGLASRGIVAASISYRLQDRKPVLSDIFAPLVTRVATPPGRLPSADFNRAVVAAIEDTLQAIKFMRGQAAAYGIDPERASLVGGSAGAITSNHVAYVLDDYGIQRPTIRFVGSLWGGVLIRSRDGVTKSESQLEAGESPLFAAHGDRDSSLPVSMSDALIARAREQRVPNDYFRMKDAGHDPPSFYSMPGMDGKTGFQRMLDFAGARLIR